MSQEMDSMRPIPASMFYTILPAIIQARLPKLASIRHTVVDIRGRASHIRSRSSESIQSVPGTPPPRYKSRAASICSARSSDIEESETDVNPSGIEGHSSGPVRVGFRPVETQTGIDWKYANRGLQLLTQSYEESNILAQDDNEGSSQLTRQLHVHGIAYLLRGLPKDLDPAEISSLQAAIPPRLATQPINTSLYSLLPTQHNALRSPGITQPPTLLHRTIAAIVFEMFIFFNFLLPYIKLLLGHAYRFEREHKVTQRMVNKSIAAFDGLGRKTIRLSQTVCQMNDGKVGQALGDLTFWLVQGLTGGVQQGISEGVAVLGEQNQLSKSVERP